MNNLLHNAAPTLYGAGGYTFLQVATQPDQIQHVLGIAITLITGVTQLIHLFKKKNTDEKK